MIITMFTTCFESLMINKILIISTTLALVSSPAICLANNDDKTTLDAQSYAERVKSSFDALQLKTFLHLDAKANQPEEIKDPLQIFNRKIYAFNDVIDEHLLRPLAVQYVTLVPEPAQNSYSSFRSNLKEPWNAVNQLAQGKPLQSLKTLGRFGVNTLTSLGFADPAKKLGLNNSPENFGTTLGVWGMPSGPYMVLPLFGSSTFRDGIGLIPDSFARPQSYLIDSNTLSWVNTTLEVTALRAQYLGVDSVLQGDKYAAMRDVYLQQRAFVIAEKRGEDLSSTVFAEEIEHEVIDEQFEQDIIDETPEQEDDINMQPESSQ